MDTDKLDATNQALHDLERKLSLTSNSSSTYTAQSHGSVVQDPSHSGVARRNIQSSVLQYIRDNRSEFDADRVYSDRQQHFSTSFAREYSPSAAGGAAGDKPDRATEGVPLKLSVLDPVSRDLRPEDPGNDSEDVAGDMAAYFDPDLDSDGGFDDDEYTYEDEFNDSDEEMLLPASPPRSPPREIDPNKMYGLFDFSGPDPSHCTLHRDEPVSLLNDQDDYWWLIRKMTRAERAALWEGRGSREQPSSDEEDGKIGFVPGECLETYGERLARLNCFRNEELERCSRDTLPIAECLSGSAPDLGPDALENTEQLSVHRSSSILKKTGTFAQSNKSVTFENLGDVCLDEDEGYSEDVIDFTDSYYSVGRADVPNSENDPEKHSEVLSDVYSAEEPLQIRKPRTGNAGYAQLADFSQPKLSFHDDNVSIGSFSPDTPRTEQFAGTQGPDVEEEEENLRRSVILDRLNMVTSGIEGLSNKDLTVAQEPTFGQSLARHDRSDEESEGSDCEAFFADDASQSRKKNEKTKDSVYGKKPGADTSDLPKALSDDSVNTPLTSANSLNCSAGSPKLPVSGPEKRKSRPTYDMFSPILGQLEELTERLAELEHSL